MSFLNGVSALHLFVLTLFVFNIHAKVTKKSLYIVHMELLHMPNSPNPFLPTHNWYSSIVDSLKLDNPSLENKNLFHLHSLYILTLEPFMVLVQFHCIIMKFKSLSDYIVLYFSN